MNITISAIEGTLMAAASIIPLILLLGSIEKIITLIEEFKYKRRIKLQVRHIRQSLDRDFHRAA